MNSSLKTKMIRKNIVVTIICLSSIAVGWYYLYLDENDTGSKGIGSPLAKIEKADSSVRRKASTSYAWTNAQVDQQLFRKDSLQTGESSSAMIQLSNGNLLELGENSLVVMDDSTQLSLDFIRGSAVSHTDNEDKKITVGQDGKVFIESIPIRLIKPEPLAVEFFSTEEKKSILFSWTLAGKFAEKNTASPDEKYIVDVATSRKFAPGSIQVTSANTDHTFQFEFRAGKYFWRVTSTQTHLVSDVRQFQIYKVSPVSLIWPSPFQQIEDTSGEGALQFRWIHPENGQEGVGASLGRHTVEMSDTGDFKNILFNEKIHLESGIAHVRGLKSGTWYWRIKSEYKALTLYSESRAFLFKVTAPLSPKDKISTPESSSTPIASPSPTMRNASQEAESMPSSSPTPLPLPLPPPTPVPLPLLSFPASMKPEPNTKFKITDKKRPLDVQWSSVPGAKSYEITIYQNKKQTSTPEIKIQTKTDQLSFSVRKLGLGLFSWSIRAIDQNNVLGEPSPTQPFSIVYGETLAPPEVISQEVQ